MKNSLKSLAILLICLLSIHSVSYAATVLFVPQGGTGVGTFTDNGVLVGNGTGAIQATAVGTAGHVLTSNGSGSDPTFQAQAGGGDVSKVGTPVDSQVGVWTGDGTIEGTAGLTYDGSNFLLTGDIGITGTRITKGWFTDLEVTNAIAGSITGTSAIATTVTVTDNESTSESNVITFVAGAAGSGNVGLEADGDLTYNPSTGKVTATGFIGALTGQADTVATITGLAPDTATTQATQGNITSIANLATIGTIGTGTWEADAIDHERGGLEVDVNAYSGLIAISGGSTSEVDAKSELEAQIADVADFCEADGDIYTGVHDYGGATSTEIVNGASPTVDTLGEIALDTTDDQFLVMGASLKPIQTKTRIWGVTVASTSPEFIQGGLLAVPVNLDGYTMTEIRCKVDGGTSKVIAVEDASANSTEDITCATTVTSDDGSITNATVTAAEEMYIDFGATTGTVNTVSISVFGIWTRE